MGMRLLDGVRRWGCGALIYHTIPISSKIDLFEMLLSDVFAAVMRQE
jgi:hypothetical protein